MLTDLRLAFRSLRRAPLLALTVVAMLTLGIGASAAVFAVVDGVLLRPLAYAEPEALVTLTSTTTAGADRIPTSLLDAEDMRASSRTLAALTFARGELIVERGAEGAVRRLTAFVSEDFQRTLGVRPQLGRSFTGEELRGEGGLVVVLSHGLWQRAYGGDPAVIGRPIPTDDGSYTIVGVMPPGVAWPSWAEAWSPLAPFAAGDERSARRDFRVDAAVLARLAPGATLAAAQQELSAIAARLAADHPAENAGIGVRLRSLRSEVTGPVERPLALLLAAVALLFLVACANVANLLLVRALRRRRELAVRAALGAGRGRIVRQLAMEAFLLAAGGCTGALLLAPVATQSLVSLAPATLPRTAEVAVDWPSVALAVVLACVVTFVAGLVPAWRTGAPPQAALRAGRGAPDDRADGRLQGLFVVSQLALSLALLAGATLVGRSFADAVRQDPGVDAGRLATIRLEPPPERYGTPDELDALYAEVVSRVAALPGVERVTIANHIPLAGASVGTPVEVVGAAAPDGAPREALYRLTGDGYFATVGQRIVRGRAITAAEQTRNARAAVLNESAARQFFGGDDPVGRTIVVRRQVGTRDDYGTPLTATVVGVAADVATFGPGRTAPAEVYLPFPVNSWHNAYVVARTSGDPAARLPLLQRAAREAEPALAVDDVATGARLAGRWTADRRFGTLLLGVFATIALLLSAAGVFAVTAAAVAHRTREIGVRTALGAAPAQVLAPFLRRGAWQVTAGAGLGVLLALVLARVLGGAIFGVAALDAGSYLLAALLLAVVVLLATWLPARRALAVSPTEALRAD